MKTLNLRNSLKRSPLRLAFFLIPLVLVCFTLSPAARAVLPPPAPDGGYPGGNTAEGTNALFNVNIAPSTGSANTALGAAALYSDTTGYSNTATGYYALYYNTSGYYNTANGREALSDNTSGDSNTATGYKALSANKTGTSNTATGREALYYNTSGYNTATGTQALHFNNTGYYNTASGAYALYRNTTGHDNTASGLNTLYSNTTGLYNTAYGSSALYSNTTGHDNMASGLNALYSNTTGYDNTATGTSALRSNMGGYYNTAYGFNALYSNTTGFSNTATGTSALRNNTGGTSNTANGVNALYNNTGSNNIGLGYNGGVNLTTGSKNIDIGNIGVAAESSTIRIGTAANQTRAFVAGIRGVTTVNANAVPVVIDSAGQLGTVSSSARFKKEIKPMHQTSEAILALKPVTFHYKSDSTGTPQFGLIAEEVAKVSPDLVVRDEKGEIYTVRYEAVNAMLLNEFLKEHRKVEQLKKDFESKLAEQQKQIKALTSGLEKVSAQLELNKPAPRTVLNSQ